MFKVEPKSSEAFMVGNGGVKGMDAHGEDEALGAKELKMICVNECMRNIGCS